MDYKDRIALCYDNLAAKYDLTIGRSTKTTIGKLFIEIDSLAHPTVLDIGCGTGKATFVLMQKLEGHGHFLGIDISKEMVAIARIKAEELGFINVTFEVTDAENLNLPKSQFDFVFSNQVFHWIKNRQAMLKGVYNCLKPGGKLAFVFQGENSFKELFLAYQKTKRRFPNMDLLDQPPSLTAEETEGLLREAGFRRINVFGVKRTHYISPLLFLINDNLEIAPWTVGLASQDIAILQKQVISELVKIKPKDTLKTTIETVFCYATS